VLHNKGYDVERNSLCSYEILELTNGDYEVLCEFYERIRNYLQKINIFYCSFNQKRIPEIFTYGRSKLRKMSVEEFFNNHLDNSFIHICIWTLRNYLNSIQATVYSDSFTTNPTEAWNYVSNLPNFKIIPNGDAVNPLVSTADIIIKVLEYKLQKSKRSFFKSEIEKQLVGNNNDEQIHIHKIDNRFYPKITPLKRAKFRLDNFIKHPSFFIFKTKKREIEMEFIMQNSPKLMNEIFSKDGCVLFFDQRLYSGCISDGDFLLYMDKGAKATATDVQKLTKKKLVIREIK
jgi:hypothetical protein